MFNLTLFPKENSFCYVSQGSKQFWHVLSKTANTKVLPCLAHEGGRPQSNLASLLVNIIAVRDSGTPSTCCRRSWRTLWSRNRGGRHSTGKICGIL